MATTRRPTPLFAGLVVSFALFLIGCGGGDAPTVPDESDATIARAVIGTEGGVLAHEDISLSIPAGAFNSDYEVAIVQTDSDPTVSDAPHAYRLEGLPAGWVLPLEVRMPFVPAADNKDLPPPSILVGEDAFVSSFGAVAFGYHWFTPVIEPGFLCATLPATEDPAQQTKRNEDYTLVIAEGRVPSSLTSSAGHFKLNWAGDSVALSDAEILAGYLEASYDYFQSLGFTYTRRTSWPVDVNLVGMGPELFGAYRHSRFSDQHGYLVFNTQMLTNQAEMRVTARHEFFHFVQYLFDPRNNWNKKSYAPVHHWLNEATASWSEFSAAGVTNYMPSVRTGSEGAPFNGLETGGRGDGAESHGYGMVDLILYLVDHYGTDFLVPAYDNVYLGLGGTDALDSSLDGAVPGLWDDFVIRYTMGEILPIPLMAVTGGGFAGRYEVAEGGPMEWSGTKTFNDLSARFYRIRVSDQTLPVDATLTLTASGEHTTMHAIALDNSQFTLLASGAGNLTLPNLRALLSVDYLLLMVTQSAAAPHYMGTESVLVTATVNRPQFDPTAFDEILVRWMVDGTLLFDDQTTREGIIVGNSLPHGAALQFDGLNFSCELDQRDDLGFQVNHHYGTVTGTLSADYSTVSTLTLVFFFEIIFPDETIQPGYENYLVAAGLPLNTQGAAGATWGVQGAGACAAITSLQYENAIPHWTIDSWSCSELSEVHVEFR